MGCLQNQKLKSEMINNGTYKKIKRLNNKLYKINGSNIQNEINKLIDECDENMREMFTINDIKNACYREFANKNGFTEEELRSALQMIHSRQRKKKRIINTINFALKRGYEVVFATLTFNDENINKTKETRRKNINKYLKQYDGFIFNIDFGTLNEREHYHALIFISPQHINEFIEEWHYDPKKKRRFKTINNFEDVLMIPNKYSYGFTTFQLVNTSAENEEDKLKIANYIATLTNHALKVEQTNLTINTKNLKDLKKLIDIKPKNINLKDFNFDEIEMKFY